MALAQKGIRHITVDGQRYRWKVAPNDEPGMAIVVENAASSDQHMVTWVDHGTTIAPGLVRKAILQALNSGWRPSSPGQELVFCFENPGHSSEKP